MDFAAESGHASIQSVCSLIHSQEHDAELDTSCNLTYRPWGQVMHSEPVWRVDGGL